METKIHRLRPEVKEKVYAYPLLQYQIREILDISHSNLYRLLKIDDIRLTTWDVLFAIWTFLTENEGFSGKISDLLEEKTAPQHTQPDSVPTA